MKRLGLFCLGLLWAALAQAQVTVNDPWVRATVPTQKVTGAFMQIVAQKEARLVGVNSPVAGSAEIHLSSMQDGIMKMREMKALDLPAGKAVDLKPGSYHLMLMDLKQPIKEGDSVLISLVIEYGNKKRETLSLMLPARPINSAQ